MAARCGACAWFVAALLLWAPAAIAEKNEYLHISQLCDRKHSQQLYRKVDGAVLNAENVTRVDCVMTFHTDSILQRFMLRFDKFQLDCDDYLYVYDNSNAFGPYKLNLSCSYNKRSVGIIYMEGNHVTLKYQTDGWVQMGKGFKLVITAIKTTSRGACINDFACRTGFCIDSDLICDGVNHCGDNSDETSHAFCLDQETMGRVLGVEVNVFVAVVVCVFVVCFVGIVGVVICICRRHKQQAAAAAAAAPNLASSGGHPNYQMQHGYPQMAGGHPEKPPPYPGNLYPPAGGIGYNTHQANIYYPTK